MVSTNFKQATNAQEIDEVIVFLLTIDHATITTPIRVVNDYSPLTSRGNDYLAYPFEVVLPEAGGDAQPVIKLRIDNVGTVMVDGEAKNLVHMLRQINTPPDVTLELVMRTSPDVVEASYEGMKLRTVPGNYFVIEGQVAMDDTMNAAYPALTYSAADYPGLYE